MGWTGESPKGEAMSKVEELHHQILDRIGKFAHGELQGYVSWLIIDDLISAAHAEGVEEERERILASGRRIDRDECTDSQNVMSLFVPTLSSPQRRSHDR
jgi:hypothetical protein